MVKFARRAKTKPEADEEDEAPKSKKAKVVEADNDDEDDAPAPKKAKGKAKVEDEEDDFDAAVAEDDEEDAPPKKTKKAAKVVDEDDEDAEESDDDSEDDAEEEEETPPKKAKKVKKAAAEDEDDSEEGEETPAPKKKASKAADDDEDDDAEESEEDDEEEEAPKKSKKKASSEDDDDDEEDAPRKSTLSFGNKAKALSKTEEAKAKLRSESRNKLFSFYIPRKSLNKDFTITFLDGKLDADNFFESQPAFYQHNETIGGRLTPFRSCCETEEDPLAKAGTEPKFVTAFTIIDHTGYKDKDGKRHKYLKRMYYVKDKTKNLLIKIAKANGGSLKGVTCTVSRTGDMEPNVGNSIQAIKKRKISELYEFLMENENVLPDVKPKERADKVRALVTPADYETEIVTYSAKELKNMGLIQSAKTIDEGKSKRAKALDEELDD